MKRLIISVTLLAVGAIAFSPVAASAQQANGRQRSSGSSIHELVQYNRDVRNKS